MTSPQSPRNAVILAAGFGSRLRPLTDLRPKPLVEVHGVSILHSALRNLEIIGVTEVSIVVGYRKDAIQYACGHRFGGLEINYIESSVFEKTGSAYSLWLARETLLHGDSYVLEGDVLFETDVLRRLKSHPANDAAAVAPFELGMEGSAVVLDTHGSIQEFRMKQTGANIKANGDPQLFKTMNLLRLSAGTLRNITVPVLDEMISAGAATAYIEELFAHLIEKHGMKLAAVRCDDLKWYEIDNASDHRMAESLFQDSGTALPATSRQISI